MSILSWIVLGLLAGLLANLVMRGRGGGFLTNLVLGIVGAFVGGALFHFFGGAEVTGFNLQSIGVATVGAIVVIAAYQLLVPSRESRSRS
ncbi:MAG: GlsB/YeaQ/YmgE family stress response membrane protein [Sandaracinus sp.]|nr:GlsB/YeaQ/YmgE family stress response membrane protein [Sandaracinus sp.]MCB9616159.1 GlsB/YeaQ/YmgE family stress response membrane protein [Sandaracinus sp.]MCB9617905.1 GlsB/YeaQ/YmgE family stress response membrane protein [Sandaracinus sp.]MCB9623688.1 GlsB/YeaQ/YmgE family stress response membrane protein [Sandaracinus sp.]MCB9634492.1 GlsB/YeaQ/YmgE family stress response membrane protein [Sandaracinus sp.]